MIYDDKNIYYNNTSLNSIELEVGLFSHFSYKIVSNEKF